MFQCGHLLAYSHLIDFYHVNICTAPFVSQKKHTRVFKRIRGTMTAKRCSGRRTITSISERRKRAVNDIRRRCIARMFQACRHSLGCKKTVVPRRRGEASHRSLPTVRPNLATIDNSGTCHVTYPLSSCRWSHTPPQIMSRCSICLSNFKEPVCIPCGRGIGLPPRASLSLNLKATSIAGLASEITPIHRVIKH